MILSFWMMAKDTDLPVEIFESTNEKANGNDLELYIQISRGYLLFSTLCKLIRRGGSYSSVNRKVNGTDQIDLLINYGKKRQGFPLYLLHNHYFNPPRTESIQDKINFPLDCSDFSGGVVFAALGKI